MGRMDPHFLLLQLCFFVSGFAALLYETAWTRELASVFGTSELAVSAVLAAYMAGLALGAAVISRWAPRIRRPILAYGLLELGIALGALAVPGLIRILSEIYVAWLGGIEATPEEVGLFSALFHLGGTFVVLLPCTTLMGATLPLLARHAIRREEEIGPRIGVLYGVNTAGAIAGTLSAAFFLLPEFGLRQTIYWGAAANGLVFLAASALSRVSPPLASGAKASESGRPGRPALGRRILPLIMLSGMVSFGYEVLWVRILGYVLGGSTAAFASMLASFLLGIALGSAAASRIAQTLPRAALGFSVAQLGTAFFAALSFGLADWIPNLADALGAGLSNLAGGAAIAVAVLLPTTLCIGATFPFAVRILATGAEDAAPASARVYAWNTLGSILGSIGAGFFLLPLLGFEGTLATGVWINLGLAAAAAGLLCPGRVARPCAVAAAIAAALFFVVRPGPPLDLLSRSAMTGKRFAGELEFLGVGRSATVTLVRTPYDRRLATNGLPEASIEGPAAPPDRFHEARWLALLPALARPETKRVLVIGLGGGNTLAAVPDSVEEIDLIELEPEVIEANRRVGADRTGGAPLEDPRLRIRAGDARGALTLSSQNYGAIISQPSHPWTSGASHLYTQEFFSMVADRLTPDGVFVQWMGLGFVDVELLRGLVGTLSDVFQHLVVIQPGGGVLLFLASQEPLPLLETAEVALAVGREGLAGVGVHTVEDIASAIRLSEDDVRSFAGASPRITDDHNRLAWASMKFGRIKDNKKSIRGALMEYDPASKWLREGRAEMNSDLLIRRLLLRGQPGRAQKLAAELKGADSQSALGWVRLNAKDLDRARRHFLQALELEGEHRGALAGLALVEPESAHTRSLEPAVAAVVRGRAAGARGDWAELRSLDDALAEWSPGSLLFTEAARLRIHWRLSAGDPILAAEAVDLVDILIARNRDVTDLIIRADAAGRAGMDDYGWASLERLFWKLPHSGRPRWLARRALEASQRLRNIEGAKETLRKIENAAKGPRPGA